MWTFAFVTIGTGMWMSRTLSPRPSRIRSSSRNSDQAVWNPLKQVATDLYVALFLSHHDSSPPWQPPPEIGGTGRPACRKAWMMPAIMIPFWITPSTLRLGCAASHLTVSALAVALVHLPQIVPTILRPGHALMSAIAASWNACSTGFPAMPRTIRMLPVLTRPATPAAAGELFCDQTLTA